jgi:hypothetical protein
VIHHSPTEITRAWSKRELASAKETIQQRKQEMEQLRAQSAALQERLSILQKEDEKLAVAESKYDEVEALVQALQCKRIEVNVRQKSVDALRDEVAGRELETEAAEQAAAEHEQKVQEATKSAKLLEQQRKALELKKGSLPPELAHRHDSRKVLIVQRTKVLERREAAEQEQARLGKLDCDIVRDEELAKEQRVKDQSTALLAEADAERRLKLTRGQDIQTDPQQRAKQLQDRMDACLAQFQDDASATECRFEKLFWTAKQTTQQKELEHQKWLVLLQAKINYVNSECATLEKKIKGA